MDLERQHCNHKVSSERINAGEPDGKWEVYADRPEKRMVAVRTSGA